MCTRRSEICGRAPMVLCSTWRCQSHPTRLAELGGLGFEPQELQDATSLRGAPLMHTHPPIDPDDPSGTSGEDVREPPLPGTQGTPREEFPRKGDLVDPEPAATNK